MKFIRGQQAVIQKGFRLPGRKRPFRDFYSASFTSSLHPRPSGDFSSQPPAQYLLLLQRSRAALPSCSIIQYVFSNVCCTLHHRALPSSHGELTFRPGGIDRPYQTVNLIIKTNSWISLPNDSYGGGGQTCHWRRRASIGLVNPQTRRVCIYSRPRCPGTRCPGSLAVLYECP